MSLFFYVLVHAWGLYLWVTKALAEANNASLLWGPYRPNLYVGIRPRWPDSFVAGLMWSNADNSKNLVTNLRHTCEQDEGMAGYGWTNYDVRTGGTHVVNDTGNRVDIVTQLSKPTDSTWALRVKSMSRQGADSHQRTTIFFYLGMEEFGATLDCVNNSSGDIVCSGKAAGLGNFNIRIPGHRSEHTRFRNTSVHSLMVASDRIWQAKSILSTEFKSRSTHEGMLENRPGRGNLHFIQKTFEGLFEFDVIFSSDSGSETLTSKLLTKKISKSQAEFQKRFDLVYAPQEPFKSPEHNRFSQHLMSNLIGGIGYFHGKSRLNISPAQDYSEVDLKFWEKAAATRAHAEVEEDGPHELFSA
ncbi:MAG: hypothetical protein Q9169_007923, partial [Polycauliona sp. 2 TL-2023]